MPTAARLIAGIFFSALAWFVSSLVIPYLPDGKSPGQMGNIMAFLGFAAGWLWTGARAREGVRATVGYGLTTSALIAFWGIFIFGGLEMLERSINRRFRGPMEAIQGFFEICIEYGVMILQPDILVSLIVGGLFGGWLTGQVALRWR